MKKWCTLWMTALLCGAMWSCEYDDGDLWQKVDDLDSRVEKLEKAVKETNTDLDALRRLIEAMQQNIYVTAVTQTADGFTIDFSDGTSASISNGKNGIDAPAISVKRDTDGIWYWTLDGEFMLVDGEKIRAQGTDGAPGEAGVAAVAPQVRINETTSEWEISTDGGETWSSTGVVATGKNGDSIFDGVDTSDPACVVFTLKDGTRIEVPKRVGLAISIEASDAAFSRGETRTFALTMTGVEKTTCTKPDGWKTLIDGDKLTVTAPVEANTYADEQGVIAVIGMAGNYSCMAELEVRLKKVVTVTFEGDAWRDKVACNFKPGAFSTTQFMGEDYMWIDPATQLTTVGPEGFMGGWGYPWFVCSYNSSSLDQSKYGGYLYDLYVYNPDGTEDSTTGGGNNGSDHFLTTYGYLDFDFPYGDGRPILKFADEKARTVKSIHVNSTCYFYSVATAGNGLSPILTKDVTYYATGFDAEGNETKTVTMTFATPEAVTRTWTKWDLSELGQIVSLRLNQAGGADNGYGYSLPAYYALDDITIEW